jgi:hypothetical protein
LGLERPSEWLGKMVVLSAQQPFEVTDANQIEWQL